MSIDLCSALRPRSRARSAQNGTTSRDLVNGMLRRRSRLNDAAVNGFAGEIDPEVLLF